MVAKRCDKPDPATTATGRMHCKDLPLSFGLLMALLLLGGCTDTPVPKPRGYFRIDLPTDSAHTVQSPCGFSAQVPTYARLVRGSGDVHAPANVCWVDLLFPQQGAVVYMTWRRIDGDLAELVNDAHEFKDKHEVKATRIRAKDVMNDSTRVYGTLFAVEGNVASPMVFYLTDSTSNFLYGSLYFDARPNADSLAPVTDRIRNDLLRFAHTLHW